MVKCAQASRISFDWFSIEALVKVRYVTVLILSAASISQQVRLTLFLRGSIRVQMQTSLLLPLVPLTPMLFHLSLQWRVNDAFP